MREQTRHAIRATLLAATLLVAMTDSDAATLPPVTLGWIEHVTIPALDSRVKAKLDTGATTSSLRAEVLDYTGTPHTDSRRVIFQVENETGEFLTLERKLIRTVRIKMKDGGVQRRPVVSMQFCLAGHLLSSEVNLAPRADFIYPLLIGRNMLAQARIAVDAARTFTSDAICTPAAAESESAPDAAPVR